MSVSNTFLVILFILVFTSCTDQSYIEEKPGADKLSDENVFKGYESALDKAQGVEQTIMDSAEQRKKELEEQGY